MRREAPAMSPTEYDYVPEGHDRYMGTQNRTAQWADSTSQYSHMDPPLGGVGGYMDEEYSHYDGSQSGHDGRGRSRHRRRDDFFPPGQAPTPFPHVPSAGIPPQFYDINPSGMEPLPPNSIPFPNQDPHSTPFGHPPSHHSMYPIDQEPPPLQEHYPPDIADNTLLQRVDPMSPLFPHPGSIHRSASYAGSMHQVPPFPGSIPRPPSRGGFPNYVPSHQAGMMSPAHQYPLPHIPVPISSYDYTSHHSPRSRSRSRTHSDYSYSSSDSYGSRDHYSRYYPSHPTQNYRTVHPNVGAPTVIQPSRSRPIVVPINGGVGGYVVVPAVGQSLRVIDPRDVNPLLDNRSLFGRLLSPSKWGVGRRRTSRWY